MIAESPPSDIRLFSHAWGAFVTFRGGGRGGGSKRGSKQSIIHNSLRRGGWKKPCSFLFSQDEAAAKKTHFNNALIILPSRVEAMESGGAGCGGGHLPLSSLSLSPVIRPPPSLFLAFAEK